MAAPRGRLAERPRLGFPVLAPAGSLIRRTSSSPSPLFCGRAAVLDVAAEVRSRLFLYGLWMPTFSLVPSREGVRR